jgi:hypothetical protein
MNTSGSDESKPSSDAPAEITPTPLTALDLAHLAANLDPALCNSEHEAALLNALAFYQSAARFVESNAPRTFVKMVPLTRSTPLMQVAIKKEYSTLAEREREQIEREKLRFYPKRPSDKVRELLKVTTERGVKNQLERWFLTRAKENARSAREGRAKFKKFWKDALRTDKAGEKYYAISRDRLDKVKSDEAKRHSNRSKKAAETRSQNRSKSKQAK